MSQYPSPYQPPSPQQPMSFDYYQPAAGDPLAPNRRAAVLMFIVAGLMLIGGFCCAGFGAMLPTWMAQNPEAFAELNAQLPGMNQDMLRVTMIVIAIVLLIVAIGMIVLGIFVRRGSKAAVITSIVLVILALLYWVLNLVVSLVAGQLAPTQLGANLCVGIVPLAVLGVLLMFLFQALRSSDQARAVQMQQYWQYAYQQQMYGQQQPPQQQPPPPAPPPTPPPGDSSAPPNQG